MRKIAISCLLIVLFICSCSKKEVQIPILNINGIQEIQNHSSIWIFLETEGRDTLAVLNKNNKLLNTHWIYNIDKRLSLHQIIPILQKMQANRNKDSMHKKEGMLNYFSYADISSNNNSLIKFNPIKFIFSELEYQMVLQNLVSNPILELEINDNRLYVNRKAYSENQLNSKLEEIYEMDSLSRPQIILKYKGNTSYQKYLFVKATISKSKVKLNEVEYLFN